MKTIDKIERNVRNAFSLPATLSPSCGRAYKMTVFQLYREQISEHVCCYYKHTQTHEYRNYHREQTWDGKKYHTCSNYFNPSAYSMFLLHFITPGLLLHFITQGRSILLPFIT